MNKKKIKKINKKNEKKNLKTSRNMDRIQLGIERYVTFGKLINGLTIACIIALISTAFSVGYSTYLAVKKEKGFGYILRVNEKTGEPISTETFANTNINLTDNEIEYFLRKFIVDSRTVTTEKKVFDKNLKDINFFLIAQSQQKLQSILSEENILSFFETNRTRDVEILSFSKVPQANNTYQIRWREREFDKDGRLVKRSVFNSLINVDYFQPNKDQIAINPIGLLIKDFNTTLEN